MFPNLETLLNQSWAIYKKRFKTFFGIMIVQSFAPLLLAIFPLILFFFTGPSFFLVFGGSSVNTFTLLIIATIVILAVGVSVIQLWGQVALLYAIKDREENIGFKEAYRRGWHKILSYFWISFLSSFIIVGGLFLFFIPGLIFLVWFSLASFVMISENVTGIAALLKSRDYVKGHWWNVFWRFLSIAVLVCVVLYIVVAISGLSGNKESGFLLQYFLSSLFLVPFLNIYFFLIYENLKKIKSDKISEQKFEEKKI